MTLRRRLLAPYHYAWSVFSSLRYRRPARRLTVIGVTGTKGKSSVAEMLFAILTHAGHVTALSSTIRFAVGEESHPNLFKMTLPGRGFIQKFLARALKKGATHAVVEITSEAALQYRHLNLELDALVFTNLQKEHIESHGSFENYFQAKFRIAEQLARSHKRPRTIVANADDPRGKEFLALRIEKRIPFSLEDATGVQAGVEGTAFAYGGVAFTLPHPGNFSVLNALAAIKTAEALGVPLLTCAQALSGLARIPGRAERIEEGQNFLAIVDYAHTPDSLQALYDAFGNRRKICILGNTGGGRDSWKRPEMGRIADAACDVVILTNEDPYDEDPAAIVKAMAGGISAEGRSKLQIIMNRREAIRAGLRAARAGDAVLITGKGTDPFIMGPKGTKEIWSDAAVVREELERLQEHTAE